MLHPMPIPLTLKNGESVRWRAVAVDGRTSPSWKLWTRGRDVYLCQRSLGSDLKVSLHASGTFQTSFINEEKAREWIGPDQSRHIARWTRPAEFAPGWTTLVEVVHPERELGAFEEERIASTSHAVLPVPSGMALNVTVVMSRPVPIPTSVTFPDCVHIATADLNGQDVFVIGILRPWGDVEKNIADVARNRPRGAGPSSLAPADFDPARPSARLLSSATRARDGTRYFLDLAASSPPESRP